MASALCPACAAKPITPITKAAVMKARSFMDVAVSSEIRTKRADSKSNKLVFPKYVIKKNPAKNVPTMLPIVEIADRFPTVLPVDVSLCSLSFTAYGENIPSAMLAGVKRTIVAITDEVLRSLIDAWMSVRTGSFINVVNAIKIAAEKRINARMRKDAFLSAILPPR